MAAACGADAAAVGLQAHLAVVANDRGYDPDDRQRRDVSEVSKITVHKNSYVVKSKPVKGMGTP